MQLCEDPNQRILVVVLCLTFYVTGFLGAGGRLSKARRVRFLLCRVFAVFIVPFFASHFYAARTF